MNSKTEFDWWPNNTAPFNTAKPASSGTMTLLVGKAFLTTSNVIGDSENPPTISRVDKSEINQRDHLLSSVVADVLQAC